MDRSLKGQGSCQDLPDQEQIISPYRICQIIPQHRVLKLQLQCVCWCGVCHEPQGGVWGSWFEVNRDVHLGVLEVHTDLSKLVFMLYYKNSIFWCGVRWNELFWRYFGFWSWLDLRYSYWPRLSGHPCLFGRAGDEPTWPTNWWCFFT